MSKKSEWARRPGKPKLKVIDPNSWPPKPKMQITK